MSTVGGFIDDKESVLSLCKSEAQKELFNILDKKDFEHKYNLIYTALVCCDSDKKCLNFVNWYNQKRRTREEVFDMALKYMEAGITVKAAAYTALKRRKGE